MVLEELGARHERRGDEDEDDDELGATWSTPSSSVHGMTHTEPALDREGQGQPNGCVTKNIHEWATEGVSVVDVVRVGVDGLEDGQVHGRREDEVKSVEDCQRRQVVVGARAHPTMRQN